MTLPKGALTLPKYGVANLMRLTMATAIIFALLRLLGPGGSWALYLTAYAFAPTIAILVVFLLRAQPLAIQGLAAAVTLLVFAMSMIVACGLKYGSEAMPIVALGTLVEWPGQAAVVLCLRCLIRTT